jgi:hypothetical protein
MAPRRFPPPWSAATDNWPRLNRESKTADHKWSALTGDRREHPFQCSFYPLTRPGIVYNLVNRVRHRTIGIFRCRELLCPPFPKERAGDPGRAWLARRTTQA